MVGNSTRSTMTTRAASNPLANKGKSGIANVGDENHKKVKIFGKLTEKTKRMAEKSPKEAPLKKRSAFGDITNAGKRKIPLSLKTAKSGILKIQSQNALKVVTRPVTRKSKSIEKTEDMILDSVNISNTVPDSDKIIEEFEKEQSANNDSLETGSLDSLLSDGDLCKLSIDSLTSSQEECASRDMSVDSLVISESDISIPSEDKFKIPEVVKNLPEGVRDADTDNDPFSVSEYAECIFRHMKAAERLFPVKKYLEERKNLNAGMRAILIDWLVEVQENFELYHETLYLAIRITDMYLQKKECKRENLQLIGASAMFIAAKIEERHPPPLDDFIFVCDDAYLTRQFISMETDILSTLDFQLGIPISYRFLRRYARVADAPMTTLTLARYILESSLLEYEFVDCSQSRIAAAALNLAFKMKNEGDWDKTLVYYSGYEEHELKELVIRLNKIITNPPRKNLTTVTMKYSHPVFSEVAKIPTITLPVS